MDDPVLVFEEDGGFLYKTPFSEDFKEALYGAVPRDSRHWQQPSGGKNPRHKGWWIAPTYKDVVDALVEEHFGVGSAKGACRMLCVQDHAPAQVIAVAYRTLRFLESTDDADRERLDQAVQTLEKDGRLLGPPYGAHGESTGGKSLLEDLAHPLEVPPLTPIVVRRALSQLNRTYADLAWVAEQANDLLARLHWVARDARESETAAEDPLPEHPPPSAAAPVPDADAADGDGGGSR